MSGIKRVGLDTNIFICCFEENPEFGPKSRKILEKIETGKLQAVCSSLVWAELIAQADIGSNSARVSDLKAQFVSIPNLGIVAADFEICELAGKLKSKYNIKLPDSLHLASAIHSKCDCFVSFDKNLKKVKEIRVVSFLR